MCIWVQRTRRLSNPLWMCLQICESLHFSLTQCDPARHSDTLHSFSLFFSKLYASTKISPHHCSRISALCRIHKTFCLIASGTMVLLCSPLAVSSLSHSPTLTLERNFLACIGRIKACAGRTVRAVWLEASYSMFRWASIHQ